MAHIACSLIITTKNEEASITRLLDSISSQTEKPDQVVISDAGSSDRTREIVTSFSSKIPIKLLKLSADSNRAVGRNKAIEASTHEIILITDAGCILDPTWVEEMLKPFHRVHTDVVAGYYRGEGANPFELCQIPFVLVMPDRYDPKTFLPATRSMGMRKTVWKKMGGFNESLRYAEDYIFARQLREKAYRIMAAPKAIVTWRARPTLVSFASMIAQHAQGDAYSGAWRRGVALTFVRYIAFCAFGPLFIVYLFYSVYKNYHYIRKDQALLYLPLLQVTCDLSVMWGTLKGLSLRWQEK